MSPKGGTVSTVLILLSTLASTYANLNVASVTCADNYDINLQSVSFTCSNQCNFGEASTVSSSMSYYNISSSNLYVKADYKFEAWANETFYQLVGGSNIQENLKFTEYISVCEDDNNDCSNEGGTFEVAHSYNIPSTGNMDGFFEGFNVTSRLLFYSSDYGDVLGDCEILYTSKSLYTKQSNDDDTDDTYYVQEGDDSTTTYQYMASQSSWYMKSFVYATAAFLGVYAGTQIYAKSGLCRTIELEEDNRREKLMSNSVSMSCNSDDVERLQQDIQSRIHIFKEKIPWPQVDSVKLVHEESIPWPVDSESEMESQSSPKMSPKKSPKKASKPKKEDVINVITESRSTQSDFSSKASVRDIDERSIGQVSSKSSGSRLKKLFNKKR